MSDLAAAALDRQIHEFCAAHYADPLGFVLGAYRWPIHGMAGPDRWQAEVLEELGRAIRARRYDGVTSVAPIRKAISAGYGVGKAHPVDLVIDTPRGPRRVGTLVPGDHVFGSDGRPTCVVAVHERGRLPIYRVSFDDGTWTHTCADHLWAVRGRSTRRRGAWVWETRSTQELRRLGLRRGGAAGRARWWEIPVVGPLQFPYGGVPVEPYTLGAGLGDGTRRSSQISDAPASGVRARVLAAGYHCSGRYARPDGADRGFAISDLRGHLK